MSRVVLSRLLSARPRVWAVLGVVLCLVLPVFFGPNLWLLLAIVTSIATAVGVHAAALTWYYQRALAPPVRSELGAAAKRKSLRF